MKNNMNMESEQDRICNVCNIEKPIFHFYYRDPSLTSRKATCSECLNKRTYLAKKSRMTPAEQLIENSRISAGRRGIEHTITVDDITPLPDICKYLGIKLDYTRTKESGVLRAFNVPTIDRIDSSRGYVPGNVQIISDKANSMKNNASIDQLMAFALGVLRNHTDKYKDILG